MTYLTQPDKPESAHMEILRHDILRLAHNPSDAPEAVIARAEAYLAFVTDPEDEEWSEKDE
jgi:hypothetical protein